ncbi:hypothetical protein KM043_010805 [Ampulex compressa]|nr:hypothetical protein KM043_010805 [Ampulex compressa]
MGGPGAGRVTRHELNAVPKSHVGHGDRVLVIGEPPAPGCRCHSSAPGVPSGQLPPSPPPLTSLHIGNPTGNGIACAVIGNNNTTNPSAVSNGTKAAAAMSSPPKHRRGFDPNDATVNDYRRYRRVKTRQRGFVCSTPRPWATDTDLPDIPRHIHEHKALIMKKKKRHTQACDVRCWTALLVVPPPATGKITMRLE